METVRDAGTGYLALITEFQNSHWTDADLRVEVAEQLATSRTGRGR